ncbi:hypothetical protein ES703_115011 [subsurface metagenome]
MFDAELNEIDKVLYGPQTTDISQGRSPDGANTFEFFELPTPHVANPSGATITVTNLIAIDGVWSYEQSNTDLGTAWRAVDYNDSLWPAGAALLYVESSALPAPKNTPLTLGPRTYYFRTHFTLDVDPNDVMEFKLSTVIDDGAVFYINGEEAFRLGIDEGTVVQHSTLADRTVDNATYEGPFIIPSSYFHQGDNVIAVEVHQCTPGSKDIVFGLELNAVVEIIDQSLECPLALLDGLRITEIMYNPNDPNTEYIELKNIGAQTINLNLVKFTNGIDFTFQNLELVPDDYVVVVQDRQAFETRYGAALNIAGEYSGRLNNAGERIRLEDAIGQTILDFDYKDGWRSITDGDGFSLTVIDPANTDPYGWNEKDSWRASAYLSGSPGEDDSGIIPNPGSVVINEVLAHSHADAADWIEMHNTTSTAIDIGGWFLSDSSSDLTKYQIAAGTIIAPDGYIVFYEDRHFNNPSAPGSNQPFALSKNGERLYLSSAESGLLTGYRNRNISREGKVNTIGELPRLSFVITI